MGSQRPAAMLLLMAGLLALGTSACSDDHGSADLAAATAGAAQSDGGEQPAGADERQLTSLAWLEGYWRADAGPRIVFERWQRVAGGLEGAGAMADAPDGQPQTYEQMRLTLNGDQLQFIVTGAGNEEPVAFTLTHAGDSRWRFENPEHDFPRRIDYIKISDQRFRAEVSDGSGPEGNGFTLDFHRQPAASN